LARISIMVVPGESSMNSGASASFPSDLVSRVQSDSSIRPVRSRCMSTVHSAHISRCTSSVLLISSENTTVGTPAFTAACLAMSRPMVELCVGTIDRPAR
jgi:hypothetical protein